MASLEAESAVAPLPESGIVALVEVKIPAIIREDEGGGLWAEVPALPGCATQGADLDALLANIREAVEGWLAARHDQETRGDGR